MAKDTDKSKSASPSTVKLEAPQTITFGWRGREHQVYVPSGDYTVVDDDPAQPGVDAYRFTMQKTVAKSLNLL